MFLIFLSLKNFMLPSASAMLFDGTPIIFLGSIILAYFMVTNIKNQATTSQDIPLIVNEHNMNTNTQDYSSLITFDNQSQNNKTVVTQQNKEEEIEAIPEKEIIFNKR